MLLARQVAKELGEDPVKIKQILSSIDQNAILEEEKAKLQVQVWDGVSPISGIPADQWHIHGEVPVGGKVFILVEASTGFVVRFQPHVPHAIGRAPMTAEQAIMYGTEFRDQVSEQAANARVMRLVEEALDAML